jgi:hypothetical protein
MLAAILSESSDFSFLNQYVNISEYKIMNIPVVLYWYSARSLTFKETYRSRIRC